MRGDVQCERGLPKKTKGGEPQNYHLDTKEMEHYEGN